MNHQFLILAGIVFACMIVVIVVSELEIFKIRRENSSLQQEVKRLNRSVTMSQKFSSFARMRIIAGSAPIVLVKHLPEGLDAGDKPRYEAICNGKTIFPWADSVYFEVPLDEMSMIKEK